MKRGQMRCGRVHGLKHGTIEASAGHSTSHPGLPWREIPSGAGGGGWQPGLTCATPYLRSQSVISAGSGLAVRSPPSSTMHRSAFLLVCSPFLKPANMYGRFIQPPPLLLAIQSSLSIGELPSSSVCAANPRRTPSAATAAWFPPPLRQRPIVPFPPRDSQGQGRGGAARCAFSRCAFARSAWT